MAQGNYFGARLSVKVEDGRLVIEIGVNVLAHAVSYADWANPYNEKKQDYIRTFAIIDAVAFANDVKRMMLDEREDGSSLLSDFLDKTSEEAVNDGSEACEFEQHIVTGETAACEASWALARQDDPT